MRSIGRLAVVTGTLLLASACSDGAGTPPPDNTGPTADFDVPPCIINVPCDFTSKSSDDVAVTDWSWDFNGDNHPDANTASASFRYETAADFSVSLTVRDAQGLSDTKTSTITIAPGNTPPTASFTYTCNRADCTFTSTSTDVAPGTIEIYAWTFGDGGTADVSSPSHSYAATVPTDFTVTLTVTDNEGATDVETQTITVTPVNPPPTAGFTYNCSAATCRFTSTSTDLAPGTITTYAWNFGDHGTANVIDPMHVYAITVPTDFTVTLTVTDNEGATDVETLTISVSPPVPGAEGCTTKVISDRNVVDCAFNVTARSTMKVKLLGINCDLEGQRVVTPPPIGDQVFLKVCSRSVGEEIGIYGGPQDRLIVYEAGSQVVIRFFQGFPDRNHPVLELPSATFEGTFPDWTMHFEDGSEPGKPGEPDFADLVVGLHATVVP